MVQIKEEEGLSLREMKAELKFLSKSDGSAFLSQGITTILASVSGPIEVKLQNLNVEKATVEVYYRPKSGLSSVENRFKENFIHHAIESSVLSGLHPRTSYKVQIQEMENRGGLLACAINATCLAFINSGLELRLLIAAVHCIVNEDGDIVIDPDLKEKDVTHNSLTFVFDNIERKTIAVHTTGKFTQQQYHEAMETCRNASGKVFEFYQEIIKKFSDVL